MKKTRTFFLLLAVYFSVITITAALEMIVETVRLNNKPAADIIPLVKPFLPEYAIVSGDGYKILVKTTPANMQEVKQLIADLDTPVHQLEISLSYNSEVMKQNLKKKNKPATSDVTAPTDDVTIRIHKPGMPAESSRYYKTEGRQVEPGLYTLQVLEDRWATVRTGEAVPIVERHINPDGTVTESIRYRQINSGFHVKPTLHGNVVTLAIATFSEKESKKGGGKIATYKTTSTVNTRLGEWIPLSATTGKPVTLAGKKVHQTQRQGERQRLIYLKVDIVP